MRKSPNIKERTTQNSTQNMEKREKKTKKWGGGAEYRFYLCPVILNKMLNCYTGGNDKLLCKIYAKYGKCQGLKFILGSAHILAHLHFIFLYFLHVI